jgi:hypothetical protein
MRERADANSPAQYSRRLRPLVNFCQFCGCDDIPFSMGFSLTQSLTLTTTVPIEFGFPWATVPEHRIAMRADAKPIFETYLQSRVDRCVLEVNAPESRESESGHLPDHVGDDFDDLEMLGAGHFVPSTTQLDAGDVVHEHVLTSDGV